MNEKWNLEKLASKVDFIFGFPFPSDSFNYDKGHPVVKIGNVKSGETDTLVDHDWVEKAKVVNGDIIFGMSGDFNISKWKSADALLNQRTCAIRNKTKDDYVSFLFYALEQPLKELNNTTQATMIKNLSAQQLRSLKILMPDAITAGKIVTFLNRETSKIDSLSDELTKFKANLLLQKRGLVSECVTKGIPSERDRAYKDSGVEWLGEVPAGWEVSKLKRMATCHDNLRKPLNAEERGEVQGEYAYWGANSIQDYVNDYLVEGETVLLGEDAAPFFDKIKNVAFYTEEKIWPNNHIHVLKVKDGVNPRYFTEALNTVDYSAYITGSIRDKLTQGAMMRITLPLPPLDEQQRIADYLDVECARIDALIGEIDNQVNLLKTYRKSLINEVVTGKIEV